MMIPTTISITELRRQSASVLNSLPKKKILLILQNSKPKGVLVDLEYLKMLQEVYEEFLDIQTFDKTINEPTISWADYQKRSEKKK